MKEDIFYIILVVILGVCSFIGAYSGYHKDNTRDYQWEWYCDSVFIADPDYYNDVLVETDKFQIYIEEHGQWWDE